MEHVNIMKILFYGYKAHSFHHAVIGFCTSEYHQHGLCNKSFQSERIIVTYSAETDFAHDIRPLINIRLASLESRCRV